MKLIFLDIDGVLNHQSFYENTDYSVRNKERERLDDEWGDMFCPKSTAWYNKLTDATGAKTVVSSSKRHIEGNLDYMRQMWLNRGFTGELLSITPFLSFKQQATRTAARGCEIQTWLERRGFYNIFWSEEEQQIVMDRTNIENYIIIDDDSDMLYTQRKHFVHVLPHPRHNTGFDELFFNEALAKLSKTVIELNY